MDDENYTLSIWGNGGLHDEESEGEMKFAKWGQVEIELPSHWETGEVRGLADGEETEDGRGEKPQQDKDNEDRKTVGDTVKRHGPILGESPLKKWEFDQLI